MSKIALSCNGQSLTYDSLEEWSSRFASQLPVNSLIGVLAPSSFEYVVAMKAAWKVGAMCVPLQPLHPVAELEYILNDSKLKTLLVHPSCVGLAAKLRAAVDDLNVLPIERSKSSPLANGHAPDADAGALLIYTSGTTSKPKGAVITFGNLDFQVSTLLKAWGWQPADRIVNVLPLHHVHGVINILCCSLAAGAHCELYPKFEAAQVWDRLASGDVSVFMAVPTVYSKLVQYWDEQPSDRQKSLSAAAGKLRLMVSGSAALPLPLFEKWERITGHRLLERYGMTEIGMAISNPYEGERKPKSVGKPLPGVDVRFGPGDELEVRGPNVFREYWGKPDLTKASFTPDGWFKTGDIARRDDEGYFYILGRASQDIIKCGGYKISALEIESTLLEFESLSEVAVVGVPDQEWGERIAVACVWKGGHDETESLKTWLKEKLAAYKTPTIWKTVEALPRNAMGKVTKPAIRANFLAEPL